MNLKKSIGRHSETAQHKENVQRMRKETEQDMKDQVRQQHIGLIIGRQAYRLLKYCRLFADFEIDMLLLADANVKIGNMNHSRKFASGIRPSFAEVIDDRLKQYLAQPLDTIASLPPIGIMADKLKTRRRTGKMILGFSLHPVC